jgi:hypothetical protein
MKTLKSLIYLLIFLGISNSHLSAQEDSAKKADNRPVKSPFATQMLIDNQTVVSPLKGSLCLLIYHRFSSMDNGISDLFGIFGSANTRLGLEYGINDRLMVGAGTTKDYQLQDVEWKYAILRQTRSNSMPVSLSYYGNFVIDASPEENFGPEESYKFIHRISYFTQLIVSRKFSNVFSFQIAPEMAYYNGIEQSMNNVNLGVSFGGRAKVWGDKSIIMEYDQPLTQHDAFDQKPNLGMGFEIGTATHAFQIFVSNYRDIIYQRNLVYNEPNNPKSDDTPDDFKMFNKFQVGFNITVRF